MSTNIIGDGIIAGIIVDSVGGTEVRTTVYSTGEARTRARDTYGRMAPGHTVPAWWGKIRYARLLRQAQRVRHAV